MSRGDAFNISPGLTISAAEMRNGENPRYHRSPQLLLSGTFHSVFARIA